MSEKNKIAIDIVLSLPPKIEEICCEINKQSDKTYVSFREGNKPHISLAMGCVNKDDVEKIKDDLLSNSNNFTNIELSILKFDTAKFRDYFINGFSISLTDQIKDLHERCMDIITKYNAGESTIEMFNEAEKVDELTLSWMNKYKETSSGINYNPHITLGVGLSNSVALPINFNVDEIAIYQLGPYCTCKNKLAEIMLK